MRLLWMLLPILQVLFAVHAYRHDKSFWIYIIIFVPGAGILVYFFAEFLPSLSNNQRIRSVSSSIGNRIYPERDLQKLKDELALNNSVKNRMALAEGYKQCGRIVEAITLLQSCLDGVYKNDPHIIFELATAHFVAGHFTDALDLLTTLQKNHTDFKRVDITRYLAFIHEEEGDLEQAFAEYESILKASIGEETRCRYAQALQKAGKFEEAMFLYRAIISNTRISPPYYKKIEQKWIAIANKELKSYQPVKT